MSSALKLELPPAWRSVSFAQSMRCIPDGQDFFRRSTPTSRETDSADSGLEELAPCVSSEVESSAPGPLPAANRVVCTICRMVWPASLIHSAQVRYG